MQAKVIFKHHWTNKYFYNHLNKSKMAANLLKNWVKRSIFIETYKCDTSLTLFFSRRIYFCTLKKYLSIIVRINLIHNYFNRSKMATKLFKKPSQTVNFYENTLTSLIKKRLRKKNKIGLILCTLYYFCFFTAIQLLSYRVR